MHYIFQYQKPLIRLKYSYLFTLFFWGQFRRFKFNSPLKLVEVKFFLGTYINIWPYSIWYIGIRIKKSITVRLWVLHTWIKHRYWKYVCRFSHLYKIPNFAKKNVNRPCICIRYFLKMLVLMFNIKSCLNLLITI